MGPDLVALEQDDRVAVAGEALGDGAADHTPAHDRHSGHAPFLGLDRRTFVRYSCDASCSALASFLGGPFDTGERCKKTSTPPFRPFTSASGARRSGGPTACPRLLPG